MPQHKMMALEDVFSKVTTNFKILCLAKLIKVKSLAVLPQDSYILGQMTCFPYNQNRQKPAF